jgi:chromosome segregation ATPase
VRKLTVENKSLKLGSEKLEEEKKLLEETWEKKNENLAKELLNKSDLINKQLDEISEHSKKIKELEAENLNLREVQKEEKKRLKDITNNLNFEKENLSKWAEEKEKLIKESNMKSKEIAGQLKKIHGLEVEIARLIQLQTREKELMAKIETLEEQLSAEWKKLEKMEEQKVIWLSEIENSKKLQKTLQKRAESYQKIIQEIVVLGKSGKSIPIYTV